MTDHAQDPDAFAPALQTACHEVHLRRKGGRRDAREEITAAAGHPTTDRRLRRPDHQGKFPR